MQTVIQTETHNNVSLLQAFKTNNTNNMHNDDDKNKKIINNNSKDNYLHGAACLT
jgi:hypothetical protein